MNYIFDRADFPFRFTAQPYMRPSGLQVKAPVSHVGTSVHRVWFTGPCFTGPSACLHAYQVQRNQWWCGIQDHDKEFAQQVPGEVLKMDVADIGLVEITGPQRRVLQTTICKTE